MSDIAAKSKASSFRVSQIAMIGVVTAVTCVLGPLALPIGPVPISLTNLVIYFSLYVLGMRNATISYLVYLLLGLFLPVFSGGAGGPGKLFGPTGGYLFGFIPMAILGGIVIDRYMDQRVRCFLALVVGTVICYGFGTTWLAYQAHMTFAAALAAGVIPFIIGDLIKIVLAVVIGPQLRKRLAKAGVYA